MVMQATESEVKSCYSVGSLFSSFSSFSSFWSRPIPALSVAPVETPTTVESAPTAELSPNTRRKMLIADDSPIKRTVIGGHMRRAGYECHFAKDGEEALEQHQNNSDFDAILIDIRMPKKNGIEVTKEIRIREKQLGKRKVPVLSISSSPRDDSEGIIGTYLATPVTQTALLEALSKALNTVEVASHMHIQLRRHKLRNSAL